MKAEERIENLIKPLIKEWLDQSKCNNNIQDSKENDFKKAKLQCAIQLDAMLRWTPSQIN